MRRRRCVVDTNVLISALLRPGGQAAQALEAIRVVNGVMLFSDATFAELATRLTRAKFDRYLEPALRRRFLADLAGVGEWVAIPGVLKACRAPTTTSFWRRPSRARLTASSPATAISWRSIRFADCAS
jgi:uncharacterized protein